jgi:DNA polymerase-1
MTDSTNQKLLIIDGNAIIHRAYHALPPMITKDGKVVNAVYGFASMFLKVWRELKPTHIAVTFDVSGGTFRDDIYKEYKGTRVKADQALYDQIPLVHELVEGFGIKIFEKKGFEADDVIGTLVTESRQAQKSMEVYIVTGDMDTLQLVQEGVKVYTMRKGITDTIIYDMEEVKKRYGFGPEQVIDYKALRGDTSDNIPGVPGIGEKTGTELIQKFGSLENLYTSLENKSAVDLKPAVLKKLTEGKEKAFMSKELATIKTDVPELGFKLADCALRPFDREKIVELFQKFEFVSLLKRLPEFRGTHEMLPTGAEKMVAKSGSKKTVSKPTMIFQEVNSVEQLAKVKKQILETKNFAAKIITQGDNLFTTTIQTIVLMVGDRAYAVTGQLWKDTREIFEQTEFELIGHDLKPFVKQARVHGVQVANQLTDVMIASYLLNPGSRSHDLTSIVLKLFGKELVVGEGQGSLFGVDARVVAEELGYCLRAAEVFKKDLEKIDDYGLFKKMEMPLLQVLATMELNGISVDTVMLKKISETAVEALKKISATIYELAGTEFNIASPVQLRDVLFDKLAIPVEGLKKGKTGLSTSADSLEKLRDVHPVIPYIEQFRELTKLQNTYVDVLPTLINSTTGRIHTTFNQAVAATGRLSSTDPNLQNIPIRTPLGREIRKAFVAAPGMTLLSADYSQIELRVVASLAEDAKMMEIFNAGLDIHKATAAAIHGVPLEEVTKEMRYSAKEVNFGVLYGMGTYGLSSRTGISFAEAKEFIEKYFREFSGVRQYIDRTLEFTKKEGYCETLFGRRRYIPELGSSNFQVRSAAERMAVNHPIQGTAADIMKLAMIEVDKRLSQEYVHNTSVKLLLQVHDELVVECPPDLTEKVGGLMKEAMESVVKLRVPIRVDLKKGERWGEME